MGYATYQRTPPKDKDDVPLKLAALEIDDLRFIIELTHARILSPIEISNFAT